MKLLNKVVYIFVIFIFVGEASFSFTGLVQAATPVIITPANSPIVGVGGTYKFTANIPVNWSMAPGSKGTIDVDGTYHAPASIKAKQQINGCQLLPNNHIFNTRIDSLPVDSKSSGWMAVLPVFHVSIGPSFGMNSVNNSTPWTPMQWFYTPANNGQFQIPSGPNFKQESGALLNPTVDADRHITSVNTDNCEFTDIYKQYPAGNNPQNLSATGQSGVKYAGASIALPVSGATDAAGMQLVPLSDRLDELESGVVNHAMRFTLANAWIVPKYVWPATGNAYPYSTTMFPYGTRFRLKSTFDTSGFSAKAKVFLNQMRQYGMILADGGSNFDIQTMTDVYEDPAIASAIGEIGGSSLRSSDFEVVDESSLMVSPDSGEVKYNNGYVIPDDYAVVIATDKTDSSNKTQLGVALQAVTVGVPNTAVVIQAGVIKQFTGTVKGSSNSSLVWNMSPSVGTLSSTGLYSAPSVSVPTVTTLTATSAIDPLAAASIRLTVLPAGGIRINVGGVSGKPGIPITNGYYGPDTNGNMWWNDPGYEGAGGSAADNWYGTTWANIPDIALYYTSQYTLGDWTYHFVVPNGNYKVNLMFARFSLSNNSNQAIPDGIEERMAIESQGQTINSSFDFKAAINNTAGVPVTVPFTVAVTDNNFYFTLRRLSPQNDLNKDWPPIMSAFSILPTLPGDLATPSADTFPPVLSNISSSSVATTTAAITWLSDESADTQVDFGTTTSYGFSSTLNTTLGLNHSVNLVNLSPGTMYNYRVKSRDSAGNLAVSSNRTFTTLIAPSTPAVPISTAAAWNYNSWMYRKKITIDHTKISAALSNFPVAISFTDSDLQKAGKADGTDIFFTGSDGIKLNHEIESFNASNGTLVAWVNVPLLSNTADTTIYLYYGNAGASDQQNKGTVWDSGYAAVWHLADITSLLKDATANNVQGTNKGAIAGSGLLGNGVLLSGSNGIAAVTTPVAQYSSSAWFKTSNGQQDAYRVIVGRSSVPGTYTSRNYYMMLDSTPGVGPGLLTSMHYDSSSRQQEVATNIRYDDNNWHYAVTTYDGTQMKLYIDGALVNTASSATPPFQASGQTFIGYDGAYNSSNFTGTIDEVRISSVPRSSQWIKTEYNNQLSPQTFIMLSAQEVYQTSVVTPPIVSSTPSGGSPAGTGSASGGSGGNSNTPPSFATNPPPASPASLPSLIQPNSRTVKLINDNGTFYLVQNGQRNGITNPGMLYSYGLTFESAKPATAADLSVSQGPLLLPSDGSLVKSSEDQTIYLISLGQRYGFTSALVFNALGYKFDSVLMVTNPELQALPRAANLSDGTKAHLPGTDINRNGTIYYISSDSQLHPYPSLSVYNSWHRKNVFSAVVPANSADRSLLKGDEVVPRFVE